MATTAVKPQTEKGKASRSGLISIVVLVVVCAAGLIWWNSGGKEDVLFTLQPAFRVSSIDVKAGTLTLESANEAFVLRCAEQCSGFQTGHEYRLLYEGHFIKLKRDGRILRFPILQEHVNFDVTGGRG